MNPRLGCLPSSLHTFTFAIMAYVPYIMKAESTMRVSPSMESAAAGGRKAGLSCAECRRFVIPYTAVFESTSSLDL